MTIKKTVRGKTLLYRLCSLPRTSKERKRERERERNYRKSTHRKSSCHSHTHTQCIWIVENCISCWASRPEAYKITTAPNELHGQYTLMGLRRGTRTKALAPWIKQKLAVIYAVCLLFEVVRTVSCSFTVCVKRGGREFRVRHTWLEPLISETNVHLRRDQKRLVQ